LLDTYRHTLEIERDCDIQSNWQDIKEDIVEVVEYRIESTQQSWYRKVYTDCLRLVDRFDPHEPQDINHFPQGILAEVFFMNACRQVGLNCIPSYGEEDIIGADFKIINGETRFLDVTMNTSSSNLVYKIKEGTFPTLFLPWRAAKSPQGTNMSFAYVYLDRGSFNGRAFLYSTISSNMEILHCLKTNVWRGEDEIRKILGNTYTNFSGSGIQYIRSLEGVLKLMRKNL